MKQKTSKFIVIIAMIVVVLLVVGALFNGCTQHITNKSNYKHTNSTIKNIPASTPLGVLLGCSLHEKGFNEEQCGNMWYMEIIINGK